MYSIELITSFDDYPLRFSKSTSELKCFEHVITLLSLLFSRSKVANRTRYLLQPVYCSSFRKWSALKIADREHDFASAVINKVNQVDRKKRQVNECVGQFGSRVLNSTCSKVQQNQPIPLPDWLSKIKRETVLSHLLRHASTLE